jgi:hypothetical protein
MEITQKHPQAYVLSGRKKWVVAMISSLILAEVGSGIAMTSESTGRLWDGKMPRLLLTGSARLVEFSMLDNLLQGLDARMVVVRIPVVAATSRR